MLETSSDFSLAMLLTSPATSIPLILTKVTKATQADLNMSFIEYWDPHLGATNLLTFKPGLWKPRHIYLVTGVKWCETQRI